MSAVVAAPTARRHPGLVAVGRWMASFLGFPIGGLLALSTVGALDAPTTALVGGALTGAVLGAVQVVAAPQLPRAAWVLATAGGLSVGLALGSGVVGYETTLGSLVTQGAICGAVLGVAQAAVLTRSSPLRRWQCAAWAPWLSASWALGWAVTTSAGVDVEQQFTVFGATGAIVVTALTAVLPWLLHGRRT